VKKSPVGEVVSGRRRLATPTHKPYMLAMVPCLVEICMVVSISRPEDDTKRQYGQRDIARRRSDFRDESVAPP
jgi:hypothetical protein